jgi:hypothetical protein
MKSRFKEEVKGRSEGRKSIILSEGYQATPARPSGRNNVKVKKIFEAEALSNTS